MSLRPDGRAISFFGDLHPSFSGNVVKAMGSAKRGYPYRLANPREGKASSHERAGRETLNGELRAIVHDVIRLTPNIVEVVVKAPWRPERSSPASSIVFRIRGIGAAWKEPRWQWKVSHSPARRSIVSEGLLSTIVLEMGGSSDLCALLKPGEPVILMGPTGTPTETPRMRPRCWSAEDSGTPCCSPSAKDCGRAVPVSCISRATRNHRPLQGRRDRSRRRCCRVVL